MKSLDKKIIERIISMRKRGFSYKEIANKTKISKSTAYKYSYRIALDNTSKERLRGKIINNYKRFAKKYGKAKRIKKSGLTRFKVRLIAHCLFDGWVIKGMFGYTNKNIVLLKQFLKDVKAVYGIRGFIRPKKRNDVWEVIVNSINATNDLFDYYKTYKTHNQVILKIPGAIKKNKQLCRIFLKAFWDDEGTVGFYPHKKIRRVRAPCWNKFLRKGIIKMHNNIGIAAREEEKKYVVISGKENLARFRKSIGFTHGIKVGKKKSGNARWTGVNKSEILNRMVLSFQK